MKGAIIFSVAFAVLVQYDFACGQRPLVPPNLTAGELWNPYTWLYPFGIASTESYLSYLQQAQQITNELYNQIYGTNAFPWITGIWAPQKPNIPQNGGNSQNNPNGQNAEKEKEKPSKEENQEAEAEKEKPEAEAEEDKPESEAAEDNDQ